MIERLVRLSFSRPRQGSEALPTSRHRFGRHMQLISLKPGADTRLKLNLGDFQPLLLPYYFLLLVCAQVSDVRKDG